MARLASDESVRQAISIELLKRGWTVEGDSNSVFYKKGIWFSVNPAVHSEGNYKSIIDIKRSSWKIEWGRDVLCCGKFPAVLSKFSTVDDEDVKNAAINALCDSADSHANMSNRERLLQRKVIDRYTDGIKVYNESPLDHFTGKMVVKDNLDQILQFTIDFDQNSIFINDGKADDTVINIEQFIQLCEQGVFLAAEGCESVSSGDLSNYKETGEHFILDKIENSFTDINEWFDFLDIVKSAKNPTLYLKSKNNRKAIYKLTKDYNIKLDDNILNNELSLELIDLIGVSTQKGISYEAALKPGLPSIILKNMLNSIDSRIFTIQQEMQKASIHRNVRPWLLKNGITDYSKYNGIESASEAALLHESNDLRQLFRTASHNDVSTIILNDPADLEMYRTYFMFDCDSKDANTWGTWLTELTSSKIEAVYDSNNGFGIRYGMFTFFRDFNSVFIENNENKEISFRITCINNELIRGGSHPFTIYW